MRDNLRYGYSPAFLELRLLFPCEIPHKRRDGALFMPPSAGVWLGLLIQSHTSYYCSPLLWLGMEDSNLRYLIQSQASYR